MDDMMARCRGCKALLGLEDVAEISYTVWIMDPNATKMGWQDRVALDYVIQYLRCSWSI
jgi:hypothetical protein